MIVEERCYTLRPGTLPSYLEEYARAGFDLQSRYLGHPYGWFSTEIGALNQVVHLWRYDDHVDRDRRRSALLADPEWRKVVQGLLPSIECMSNRILLPAPFAPLG
jgi:hypothetical protein